MAQYTATRHAATGVSPFRLLFSGEPRMIQDPVVGPSNMKSTEEWVSELGETHRVAWEAVKDHEKGQKGIDKRNSNAGAKGSNWVVEKRPTLVAAAEDFPIIKSSMVDDPEAPGEQRLMFIGPIANMVDFIAKAMNFSYRYVRSPDRAWGSRKSDGSWSGMVGLVTRESADIGVGPFSTSSSRAEVVDFTWPVSQDQWKILAGRGRPEVDPWGFLLPLTPLVWVAILTTLLVVVAARGLLLISCSFKTTTRSMRSPDAFTFTRVLLQQDILIPASWHWERLVLGVWMMVTLVLTRSYAGNLMSLLAVRHIPQPYQSLRDVLDDPAVNMIWQKNSVLSQYFQFVKSGLFREVGDLAKHDRLIYKNPQEFPSSVDQLVRPGDHVLVEVQLSVIMLMAQDFSRTGQCDFYTSRDGYLSARLSMIVKKDSPLAPAINMRIMTLMETGLREFWLNSFVGNSTTCLHSPKKITITSQLALRSLLGMFVALGVGHVVSLVVLFLEILLPCISSKTFHVPSTSA
ncbi:probable glutamate receptor [Panulirus ornatus]|uniref:probable glutamate receptor n=1 Tax=Panulirus ornatus TaxID=150431 RepID=UPI003A837F5A